MSTARIVLYQNIIMALYMLIGFILYKRKRIDERGSGAIANLLVYVVIPSTLLQSFCVEYTPRHLFELAFSFLLAGMALALSMLIACAVFKKNPVDQFAASFSNAGFIGIPLVQKALGNEAVFFLTGMLILLNILQWTVGAGMLTRGTDHAQKVTIKKIFFNPIVLSALAGFVIFLSGFGDSLPSVISGCINGVAALNAPLAMIVLGVYLAQTNLPDLVRERRLFLVSFIRLLVIPLAVLFVLSFLPFDNTLRLTILIGISAPAGANTAIYSQLYGGDYQHACKTVTQSTVLSIITLPLVIAIASFVF